MKNHTDFRKGQKVRHIHTGVKYFILGPHQGPFEVFNLLTEGQVRCQRINSLSTKEEYLDSEFLDFIDVL